MIQLKNFSIGYDGHDLLKDTDTVFPDNELTALIGRNGCGKSTLLRALCELNRNYKGDILINDENLKELTPLQIASKIAFVNTSRLRVGNLRCHQIVELGRSTHTSWHGKLKDRDLQIAQNALDTVGMKEYAYRYFNSLSDGESQKIMIARAIAQDTPIIILDEPSSFLDLPTRFELGVLLRKLAHENHKTVVYSSHDLDTAILMSDRIAVIDRKNLLNIPVKETIESGVIQRIFGSDNEYISRMLDMMLKIKDLS